MLWSGTSGGTASGNGRPTQLAYAAAGRLHHPQQRRRAPSASRTSTSRRTPRWPSRRVPARASQGRMSAPAGRVTPAGPTASDHRSGSPAASGAEHRHRDEAGAEHGREGLRGRARRPPSARAGRPRAWCARGVASAARRVAGPPSSSASSATASSSGASGCVGVGGRRPDPERRQRGGRAGGDCRRQTVLGHRGAADDLRGVRGTADERPRPSARPRSATSTGRPRESVVAAGRRAPRSGASARQVGDSTASGCGRRACSSRRCRRRRRRARRGPTGRRRRASSRRRGSPPPPDRRAPAGPRPPAAARPGPAERRASSRRPGRRRVGDDDGDAVLDRRPGPRRAHDVRLGRCAPPRRRARRARRPRAAGCRPTSWCTDSASSRSATASWVCSSSAIAAWTASASPARGGTQVPGGM